MNSNAHAPVLTPSVPKLPLRLTGLVPSTQPVVSPLASTRLHAGLLKRSLHLYLYVYPGHTRPAPYGAPRARACALFRARLLTVAITAVAMAMCKWWCQVRARERACSH